MTIIILNDYAYVNGGASQVAISSAITLAKHGNKVILFTAVGPINNELLRCDNLQVICLSQNDILNDSNRIRAIINGIWNQSAASSFEQVIAVCDPDKTIIHVHSCSKALSVSCISIALKKNFKVLYHIHDYGIACPNLGFFHYPSKKICSFNPLSIKCITSNCDSRTYLHKIWRCLRQYVQDKIARIPQKIQYCAFVSNFSYQILRPYLQNNITPFFIKNPIVNIEKIKPVGVEKNKYFIFCGRLSQEKNPTLLAKAAKILELPVIFIGEGPCVDEIKEICPDAVITGWLTQSQMKTYMDQARCLVLTSALYETQGMVVAEAASRGIPAIVPHTCAATEWIVNNENGLVFQSNNEFDLVDKLRYLLEDEKVINMGKSAYEYFWKENPSMDRYIENIEMIYRKILQANLFD